MNNARGCANNLPRRAAPARSRVRATLARPDRISSLPPRDAREDRCCLKARGQTAGHPSPPPTRARWMPSPRAFSRAFVALMVSQTALSLFLNPLPPLPLAGRPRGGGFPA